MRICSFFKSPSLALSSSSSFFVPLIRRVESVSFFDWNRHFPGKVVVLNFGASTAPKCPPRNAFLLTRFCSLFSPAKSLSSCLGLRIPMKKGGFDCCGEPNALICRVMANTIGQASTDASRKMRRYVIPTAFFSWLVSVWTALWVSPLSWGRVREHISIWQTPSWLLQRKFKISYYASSLPSTGVKTNRDFVLSRQKESLWPRSTAWIIAPPCCHSSRQDRYIIIGLHRRHLSSPASSSLTVITTTVATKTKLHFFIATCRWTNVPDLVNCVCVCLSTLSLKGKDGKNRIRDGSEIYASVSSLGHNSAPYNIWAKRPFLVWLHLQIRPAGAGRLLLNPRQGLVWWKSPSTSLDIICTQMVRVFCLRAEREEKNSMCLPLGTSRASVEPSRCFRSLSALCERS